MKFNQLVQSLLLEMPHISFHSGEKVLNVNLEMEKFQKDYEGFLNHVRLIISKLGNEEAFKDFKKELEENKQFLLYLNKMFQKSMDDFFNDLNY